MSSPLHAAPDQPDRPYPVREPDDLPAAAVAAGAKDKKPRSAPSQHIDETEKHYKSRVRKAIALVIVFSLVDSIIIKTTWNQVLQQPPIISWILAICTALGAAALMWWSGALTASSRIFPNLITPLVAGAAAIAWACLGAGLFWLRWNAAALAGSSMQVEGQSTSDPAVHNHQVMAVVLISVYLLPGVLAWIDGYLLSQPIEAHQRRTAALRRSLTHQLRDLEAQAVKISQLLQLHADEIALVPEQARLAKQANAATAAELRAYARTEILRRLATPNAGGIAHPDEQPPTTHGARDSHDTRGKYPTT